MAGGLKNELDCIKAFSETDFTTDLERHRDAMFTRGSYSRAANGRPVVRTSSGDLEMIYALALLAGIAAGLRAFTPVAAVSWAARLGGLHLDGTWLAFLGYTWTPWVFSILAIVEYITDQLPSTPSRTVPFQFGARLVSGAFCGAALGLSAGSWIAGLVAGVIGAVVGTYGGAWVRARMAAGFGRDWPAALIEDAVAIVLGLMIVGSV